MGQGGSGSEGKSYNDEKLKGNTGINSLSWSKEENNAASGSASMQKSDKKEDEFSLSKIHETRILEEQKRKIHLQDLMNEQNKKYDAMGNVPAAMSMSGMSVLQVNKKEGKPANQGRREVEYFGRTFKKRNRTKRGTDLNLGVKLGMKRNAEPMEVDDELKGNAKKGKKESVFGTAVEDKGRPYGQHFNDSSKNMMKELTFFLTGSVDQAEAAEEQPHRTQ